MSMWTAIVLIVVASMVGQGWRHHTKTRNAGSKDLEALNERLETLEAELRGRIETLERIATDRKEDLKRQFDYMDKAG
jgi:hypothetical protein